MIATKLKMTAAGDSFDTVADTAGHVLIATAGRSARLRYADGLTCGQFCMCGIARLLNANCCY